MFTCKNCPRRKKCSRLCGAMETVLELERSGRDELPITEEIIETIFQSLLFSEQSRVIDRHSMYLPELDRRLELLNEGQKIVLELYYYEGYSLEDISRLLELDVSGVRKKLKRAIEIMKRG